MYFPIKINFEDQKIGQALTGPFVIYIYVFVGEIHGYRAYYDSEAQTARGCDSASASVIFESGEVVTSIDVYTSGISRGFTFYTNRGATYGPHGLTSGNLETVEGINLEYVYGRAGGLLDAVNFHFTAC